MLAYRLISLLIPAALSAAPALDSAAAVGPGWRYNLNSNLTVTSSQYSQNWAGDEVSTTSGTAQLNAAAENRYRPWLAHRTSLKASFGQTVIQQKDSAGTRTWGKPQKSNDLIDLESVLRLTLESVVDPFCGLRVVTQFRGGQDTLRHAGLNPLEVTESFGAARDLLKKPRQAWQARLAGAVRQTLDRSRPDSSQLTNDGGVEVVTELNAANGAGWLKVISRLKVFEALLSSQAAKTAATAQENWWRYPDLKWENTLLINLTKYVMLNVFVEMLYDKEVNTRLRYRQNMAIGLTYTFERK